jgi:hypothetical protein
VAPNSSSAAALHALRLGPAADVCASSGEIPRGAPTVGAPQGAEVNLRRGLGRAAAVLVDIAEIIAVAFAFPIVILAVGIPVALLVRLAIWTVRALSSW